MTMRRAASRARRDRNKNKKTRSVEQAYGVPVPEGLHEAIEIERGNLSKAESVLGCLAISMEYATDSVNGPYYPDVAEVAREMVRQSINGLDSLVLQQRLLRNKIKESADLSIAEGGYPVLDFIGMHRHAAGGPRTLAVEMRFLEVESASLVAQQEERIPVGGVNPSTRH
jgi:hypothetical protein